MENGWIILLLLAIGIGANRLSSRLKQNQDEKVPDGLHSEVAEAIRELGEVAASTIFEETKLEPVLDRETRNIAGVSYKDAEQGLFFRINPKEISHVEDERFLASSMIKESGRLEMGGVVWRLPSLAEAQSFCERYAEACRGLSEMDFSGPMEELEEVITGLKESDGVKELKDMLQRARAEHEELSKAFLDLMDTVELITHPTEVMGEQKTYAVEPNVFPSEGEASVKARPVTFDARFLPIFCVAIQDIEGTADYAKAVRSLGKLSEQRSAPE